MTDKKHVIIIGAGFGGLQAVKILGNKKDVTITIIDKTNHHLFQPLLYQIASAVLSPADIAIPVRLLTEKYKNVTVVMDEVTGIDKTSKTVTLGDRIMKYDYLILATGAETSYFGNTDWMKYTCGLKNLNDALLIRNRLLFAFEEAENQPERAAELLKFVIIGGGPTGVELAGSIAELSRRIIRKDFRNIDTAKSEIILIEGGPDLIPSFDRKLSVYTKTQLQKRGVNVLLNTRVMKIEKNKAVLKTFEGEKEIYPSLMIWAAGIEAVPLSSSLEETTDRQKRLIVNNDCSLKDHPEIFAIGDIAHYTGEDGKPLPGVGPVAMQQGRYAARTILNEIKGKPRKAFKYFFKGNMATIGRKDAVTEFRSLRLTGFIAWLAWLFVHLMYQVGFKNKVSILITWIWSYFTFGAGARVIVNPVQLKNLSES